MKPYQTANDVQYWATKLQENNDQNIVPIIKKMYEDMNSVERFDLFMLREFLTQNRSLVGLLNEELSKPLRPQSFWEKLKKLFRK